MDVAPNTRVTYSELEVSEGFGYHQIKNGPYKGGFLTVTHEDWFTIEYLGGDATLYLQHALSSQAIDIADI